MAQRIKIKRSSSATNPSNLKEGELAYIHSNNTAGKLYIGRPGTGDASTGIASSIDVIGGLIDHNKLDGISEGAEVNPDQVSATERTAGTETAERSFSPADVKSMVDTHALTGLSAATSTALGAIKLHDDTAQTTAPESVSSDANRTYAVQLDSDGKASVNVPWSDTNTQRAIHDTPVDNATTTSISSNWAFDNVKTAVPADAVFTDTVYTASTGVTVDASAKTIAIGQAVGTTDDVTFDDLTLTGSTYLDSDEGIRFPTHGTGLGYKASDTAIIPTRVTVDSLSISSMSTNERADVYRYIDRVASGTENAPATKYLHLFDINDSGSITSDDKTAWDTAVYTVLGFGQDYSDYVTAKSNATSYYTDFVQDIIDGTDDSWTTSTSRISLGTPTNAFYEIYATGDTNLGGRLTLNKSPDDLANASGLLVFKNPISNNNDISLSLNINGSFVIKEHDDDYDDNTSGDGTIDTILEVNSDKKMKGLRHIELGTHGSTNMSLSFLNPTTYTDENGDEIERPDFRFSHNGAQLKLQTSTESFADINDISTLVTYSADDGVTINGDLTVNSTTTTVNTETINLADNIIELNSNIGANNATQNAGIEINRGNYTNVKLFWDETNHDWRVETAGDAGIPATTSPLITTGNFDTNITEIDGGSFS